MKRKPISKKLRFEIFKRDLFTCQYCGRTPPQIVLELDHIVPVCAGGGAEEDNLIAACFDCNRGKAGNDLSVAPKSIVEKAETLAEKEEQLSAYKRLLTTIKRRENKVIKKLEKIFSDEFDSVFRDRFKESIRGNFLSNLMPDEVEHAMHKSCAKMYDPERALKYFCGICWHKIKGTYRG